MNHTNYLSGYFFFLAGGIVSSFVGFLPGIMIGAVVMGLLAVVHRYKVIGYRCASRK